MTPFMVNKPTLYSICATTYNCADIVERSLESIIQRAPTHEMEMVVCDSKSVDNTPQFIQKYSDHFKSLKIISKKCTRGEGRQIAFKNSTGQCIIQVDLDTVYNDAWKKFVEWHMEHLPDFAVQTWGSGIYPRRLIEQIGGWKNLTHSEDLDAWIKLAKIGKLKWSNLVTGYNFALLQDVKRIPSQIERWIRALARLRAIFALHRISFRHCLFRLGYHPLRVAVCLLAKIYSLTLRGVVDVRQYNQNEIVQKNVIELPIEGSIGKERYWRGFTMTDEPIKDRDCLTCGHPIPLSQKYCPRCFVILKKERLI